MPRWKRFFTSGKSQKSEFQSPRLLRGFSSYRNFISCASLILLRFCGILI